MPWKERTMAQSRREFVNEALTGEKSMSALCRAYEISRKTGYKWLERARNGESMQDRSHCFKSHPNQTPPEMEECVLQARTDHPAWGPRKLRQWLENQGHTGLPAASTIATILKRNGRITPEESEAHTPYKRFEKAAPNELWQMDFKGHFGLLDGTRCHPLTVLDDHSRFSLCLEAKLDEQGEGVFGSVERLFREYGLPLMILTDNGPPWGNNVSGITQFEVWMMRLGILPIHGRPLHPQTQGKEERFHRTLKAEILRRETFADVQAAQRRFDIWREEYNQERPHEALGLKTPSTRYKPSARALPLTLTEPEYDSGKNIRKVNYKGYISIRARRYYVGEPLIGRMLEIEVGSSNKATLYYGAHRSG
jgi:transposase InsO family protein